MTVQISNTELTDNFNTWRLNTNYAATVIGNNAITVRKDGRGGHTTGNAHIGGTFSATNLRATTLRAGNSTVQGSSLQVTSNVNFTSRQITVTANAVFTGNVTFSTAGLDRLTLGNISRIRMQGGTNAYFIQATGEDTIRFKQLVLGDIQDLSSNNRNFILSGANSEFSDNGDSPKLIFAGGFSNLDRMQLFLGADALAGRSDLYLTLTDASGESAFVVATNANTPAVTMTSGGQVTATGNLTSAGVSSGGNILPSTDDTYDLGSPNRRFKDAYIDGTANIDILYVATGASQGVSTSLIPTIDNTKNLGSTNRAWKDFYARGISRVNDVRATSVGISGSLNANGATTLNGLTVTTLTANGAVDLNSTLNVDGATTLNGLTVTTLTANGTTNLNGTINLGDASTDTITIKGNLANQSTTGIARFNSTVIVGSANTDIVQFKSNIKSNLYPNTHNTYDIGSNRNRWKEIYANNIVATTITANTNIVVGGDLTVSGELVVASGQAFSADDGTFVTVNATGNAEFNASVDLGTASSDLISINGSIDTSLIPTGTQNIGSGVNPWNNGFFAGTLNTDVLTVDETSTFTGAVDINNAVDISGKYSNDGTTIIGANGKLHANNTISAGTIKFSMIEALAGVVTGTFGNSTSIPVITVNNQGLVSSISNVDVASISGFSYTGANTTFTITASDGSSFTASIADTTITDNKLTTSGVAAGSYGSATTIPVITVNNKGRVTSVSTSTVAGVSSIDYIQSNNVITVSTADGSNFKAPIDAATTTSGTGRGVASFDSGDFSLSSGHVTLNNSINGAVLAINGTTKEVNVSRTNGTVTVGLPDDVTIASDLTVGGGVFISGNLIVSGTTTTVNTETINLADNIIKLNSNHTGTPTQNAGIAVNRGDIANVEFVWDETSDRWSIGSQNLYSGGNFIGNLDGTAELANTAVKLQTTRSIAGKDFNGTQNVTLSDLTAGTHLIGSSYNGSTARSFSVDATNNNTANKIVQRDALGNFSAGTITGGLNGNASTATKLAAARTISTGGGSDVGFSFSFDGSADVTGITATFNGTISASDLDDDSISTAKIEDGAVTNGKLATNAVTQEKIADDAVGQTELKDVVSLAIIDSNGTTLKTIYGAGS